MNFGKTVREGPSALVDSLILKKKNEERDKRIVSETSVLMITDTILFICIVLMKQKQQKAVNDCLVQHI